MTCAKLVLTRWIRSEGHTPYCIPVGGSNPIGTWGYIEAFNEMIEQVHALVVYLHYTVTMVILKC